MQVSTQTAQREGGLAYKWVVAIVVIFGIFMSILDSTIVNIAIPRLQSAFGGSLNNVQWVLTGYTLIQGVVTPLTAFFANRIGVKRFYIISLAIFTVGSALCGLAWSLPVLIFFRVLQGLGGAFLSPLSITLLYNEFPPNERGTAMGFLGIPLLLAPALGPTLGGYIVTYADWPLIFYINVPIGIVGIIVSTLLLREIHQGQRTSFDLPGFILAGGGLGALLYGLSSASSDGWGSSTVLGCILAGMIALALFVMVEIWRIRNERSPLLDLRLFGDRFFALGNLAGIFVIFALFGGLFLVPVYLQSLRGQSAYQAGLLLLPQALASMVSVVVGGRLVDRFGVRAVVIPGLFILAIALWQLSFADLHTPFGTFQLMLILRGFSLGLVIQPLTVAALSNIQPRQLAQASSMNTVLRFVATSLGVAVMATLVQTQTSMHYTHLAEQVTAASPLAGLITGLQGLFLSRGADPTMAHATAIQYIVGILKRQSYMLAIQDAFKFTTLLVIPAIIATFFVGGRKKTQQGQLGEHPLSEEERREAEAAREEAMLSV